MIIISRPPSTEEIAEIVSSRLTAVLFEMGWESEAAQSLIDTLTRHHLALTPTDSNTILVLEAAK